MSLPNSKPVSFEEARAAGYHWKIIPPGYPPYHFHGTDLAHIHNDATTPHIHETPSRPPLVDPATGRSR